MINIDVFRSIQAGMEAENPEELKLYNVTEKDEGWYTCIAQNTLGETFSSAYLRVVESECVTIYSKSLNIFVLFIGTKYS